MTSSPFDPKLLAVTSRPFMYSHIILSVQEQIGLPLFVVGEGAAAMDLALSPAVNTVFIDEHLPDMDGYDLCGWLRARSRSVHIVMLGSPWLDTKAVPAEDGGWTVPPAVRRRMTDPSLLDFESMPMSTERLAEALGLSLEEAEQDVADLLERTGMGSLEEVAQELAELAEAEAAASAPPAPRPGPEPERPPVRAEGAAPPRPIVAVTARHERWRHELAGLEVASGRPVGVTDSVEGVLEALSVGAVHTLLIDPELPGRSGYDLCGFIRARFRHLPLKMLGEPELKTGPVELLEGWAVPDTLRSKMTDSSVLEVTPESIPVPPVEMAAEFIGVSVEEMTARRAGMLERSGAATLAEMVHELRNRSLARPS